MGVLRPELVMRSIIPVVMAGVLGTFLCDLGSVANLFRLSQTTSNIIPYSALGHNGPAPS